MSSSEKVDVILLGSGISSLVAGLFLAKKGKSVLILEKYLKPGGYMHSFSRFGHQFETGAHYFGALHPGDPFFTILSYLGLPVEDLFVPLEDDGFDVLRFPDQEIRVPKTHEAFAENLSALFPEERLGISQILQEMKKAATYFPTYQFQMKSDLDAVQYYAETPLQTFIDRFLKAPKLKSIFSAHAVLHGVLPTDISFGFHSVMMDSLFRGAFGIKGKGDLLAQAFVKALENAGGRVLLKSEVIRLKVSETSGLIESVETPNTIYHAENVISGLHPKVTFRMVEGSSPAQKIFTPAFNRRWQNLKESEAMLGIYGAFKNLNSFHPRRNYFYFFSDQPEDLMGKAGSLAGSPIFIARPDRESASDVTRGPLQILTRGSFGWFEKWKTEKYGKRSAEYAAYKNELALQTLESLNAFGHSLKDDVEKFVVSTPLSNLHFNGSEEGSSYGIYHSIQQTGGRALGPRTHIPNLFLTGQNTLFPGLLGASIAGMRTAGHLIGPKQILKELIDWRDHCSADDLIKAPQKFLDAVGNEKNRPSLQTSTA